MNEFLKKTLVSILTVIIVLGICWGILLACVSFGMKVFGVEAFGTELPSITEPCGLSTEEFEAVLKGDLKNYAKEFLQAEADYEINAVFLASIAAAESAWGEKQFRPNNIFGFMTRKEFGSVEHNIDFVAWWLREHYLNEWGCYYRGGTIKAVGEIWCPDNGEWVDLVTSIYAQMSTEARR